MNRLRKTIIFLLFVLGCGAFGMTQRQILVLDQENKEPIAFAKVLADSIQAFFTDIDGKGTIENEQTTRLTISFSGYYDTTVLLSNEYLTTIYMRSRAKEIAEIVVLPGENPAHRIILQATENRKKNHPLGTDAFTYKSYSKFVLDADSTFKQSMIADAENQDTIDQDMRTFFDYQYLFIMESVSERTYIPPSRDRENIIAYKVSGLKNPLFSAFAQSMQTFHFYDNRFELMGKEYFNPIARGSLNRYFFLLEDSTIIGTDTTFLISFRPKPNVGSETLKGLLFINTNGFAIEKVIVQPATVNTNDQFTIKITQEYQLIDNRKWFPMDLKTTISLGNLAIESGNTTSDKIEGYGSTYITDIVLNPDNIKKQGFNNIALSTDPKAGDKTEEYWKHVRKDSISEREQNTYITLDSLSKAHRIELKVNGLLALTTGRVRIKYIALPLERIFDFNLYEGYRLGLGIETSDRVMKNNTIGSYFAYGTRDKAFKYGGYATFHINKRNGMSVHMRYQQDLLDRGGNIPVHRRWNIFSPTIYANFYRYHLDKQRLGEVRFSIAPSGSITVHALGNYQRIELTNQYIFTDRNKKNIHEVDVLETAIEVNWNMRQQTLVLGDIRMPQPSYFPRITVKIAKGWNDVERASIDYWRFALTLKEDLKSFRFGKLSFYVQMSQTVGDVPLTFKQNAVGTRHETGIISANVLETAFPGEFYHDKHAIVITRYAFPQMSMFKGKYRPQVLLHHGLGYGQMSNDTQHNIPFQIMEKGFFESGVIFRKCWSFLKYPIWDQLGFGVFYRYGEYAQTKVADNIVLKLDFSL